MWEVSTYPCPVCAGYTYRSIDRIEGTVCESETECRQCTLWRDAFSYGTYEETVIFVSWVWDHSQPTPEELAPARDEAKRAWQYREFRTMMCSEQLVPDGIVADWLGDHEFYVQERALRAIIANNGNWRKNFLARKPM